MPSCGGSPGWWGAEAVSGPIRLRLSVGGLAHTYRSWAATVAPCGELQRHPNCAPQVGIGEGGQHRSDGVGEGGVGAGTPRDRTSESRSELLAQAFQRHGQACARSTKYRRAPGVTSCAEYHSPRNRLIDSHLLVCCEAVQCGTLAFTPGARRASGFRHTLVSGTDKRWPEAQLSE